MGFSQLIGIFSLIGLLEKIPINWWKAI